MVFSSSIFVFLFLPLVFLLYFVSPEKIKNYVLLIFSLIFYIFGGPRYIIILLSIVLISYIGSLLMDKYKKNKKIILTISLILDVGILLFFKYTDFIISNINTIFNSNINLLNIVMPVGISFYTFQAISYLVDVYKKDVKVQKNFFNLLLYISFFPQLVAGPIVTYKSIEKELTSRKTTVSDISYGIERFIIGFFKKLVIANQVGALADIIFNLKDLSMPIAWLGAISYMLQIYFDFSAYSDMAIGLGRMFGFHFAENFNYPYISKSIKEFWKRWHISLSSFFKNYIYIPLGGSRTSKTKWIINLFVVWFLTGLWHGASWNFVVWGLYYFVFLIIEKLLIGSFLEKHKIIAHFYTLLVVLIGWIIFRVESIDAFANMFKSMFSFKVYDINNFLIYLETYYLYIIAGIILSTPVYKVICQKFNNDVFKIFKYIGLIIMFIVAIMFLAKNTFNPFIYFRF